MPTYADNRKARFDFELKDELEAGLVLSGPEVKSVKEGNTSLKGSYVSVSSEGAFLINAHIGPYKYAQQDNYNPTKPRKILLNKSEINALLGKEKGFVIIPMSIYSGKKGLINLKIGLGRGRKKEDKREYIKKRDDKREAREVTK